MGSGSVPGQGVLKWWTQHLVWGGYRITGSAETGTGSSSLCWARISGSQDQDHWISGTGSQLPDDHAADVDDGEEVGAELEVSARVDPADTNWQNFFHQNAQISRAVKNVSSHGWRQDCGTILDKIR